MKGYLLYPQDQDSESPLTESQKKAIWKLLNLKLEGENNADILIKETQWKKNFASINELIKEQSIIKYWIEKIDLGLRNIPDDHSLAGINFDDGSCIYIPNSFSYSNKTTPLETMRLRLLDLAYKGIDPEFLVNKKRKGFQVKETNESIKAKAHQYLEFANKEFISFAFTSTKNPDQKTNDISYNYQLKNHTKKTIDKAEEIIKFVIEWGYKLGTTLPETQQKRSTKYSRDLLKYQTTPIKRQLALFPIEQKQNLRKIEEIINAKSSKIQTTKSKGLRYDYIPEKLVLKDGEFTDDELKAIISVMILINKAKEHEQFKTIDTSLSYFTLSINEFNKYFGVPSTKRGADKKLRFTGRKSEEAKQALLNLSKKVIATHFEKRLKSGNSKSAKRKMITEVVPIINPLKISVNGEYEIGDKLPLEEGEVTVAVNRIFFENLGESGSFFFIPENINLEITTAAGGKRVSPGVRNFGVWLHSISPKKDLTWEVTYPKLIDILWLHKYQEEGRKSLIKKSIQKAFDNAIARGILEKVTEGVSVDGYVKYTLHFTQLYINFR